MDKKFNFFYFALFLTSMLLILGFIEDQVSDIDLNQPWTFYTRSIYYFSFFLLYWVYSIYFLFFFAIICIYSYFFYTKIKHLINLIKVRGFKNTFLIPFKEKETKEDLFEIFVIFLLSVFFGGLLKIISLMYPLNDLSYFLLIMIPLLIIKLYKYFSKK